MSPQGQPVAQRRTDQTTSEHEDAQPRSAGGSFAARVLCSGSLASVLSTLAVSVFSRRRSRAAAAGTNAASQWFWYPRARHVARPSLRYTATGYAVHHASSLLWAATYEATRPARAGLGGQLARATATAALAYVVDYHVVPRRLSPGFEHRIGAAGVVTAYAAFGLSLLLASRCAMRAKARGSVNPAPARQSGPARRGQAARSRGR